MNLNVLLFAPAGSGDVRLARAARSIEELLPGTSLVPESPPVPGRLPVLVDRDVEQPVVLSAVPWPAIAAPGGQPLLQLILQTSRVTTGTLTGELLSVLGETLAAYWGTATPVEAGSLIGRQVIHDPTHQTPPPGLPALGPWTLQSDPAIPSLLGWWNYWSHASIERVGAHPLNAIRLASGAVVWAVTEEPLDLSRAKHLTAFADAYARWPLIGNRQPPSR